MELAGKIVIVTGAAGNLGSACAREMARQGARVIASDIAGSTVGAVAAQIREAGGEALAHEGDVSVEADVVAMIGLAEEQFGGLDVLVNVAAAMDVVVRDGDITTMAVEDWDRMMAVNLRGAMLGCKHAIPAMRRRGGGAILHFGSTAAILGDDRLYAYSATKSGLLGFTRAIATGYGKDGIRCNAVCPGSVWSEATQAHMGAETIAFMTRTRLTPRLGVPDDVAHMVVFLASDKASYVTGQTMVVDGGGTVHQPWVRVR